ncbi:hypothetical protein K3172_11400 [Qipengyuania sp. 6B39]|uniref:DUF7662 domain-containing protein n=1 Tax=Qipengyuania proteolytica TaxID=2867239 RepID=UPI001C8A5AC0|nr:hypothetical protein [Qipengyuania proteolytica]MBX7496460.1 hypothetical protein [Qipengyuania proteolytica]
MSSKYQKLTEYLSSVDETVWEASFEQIERVLGFRLPESARQHQAWWSNQMRSQSLGWQLAGWKTTALDLENEKVTLVNVAGDDPKRQKMTASPMTIQAAKDGLAAALGIDQSQVEITIRA